MALPDPVPGLVIQFSYLWRDEALRGRDEGRKDRSCVVVLSVRTEAGRRIVTVAPITHSPPAHAETAIEISSDTKRRLGLDGERSWIVAADLNCFNWPGVDLRPVRRGSNTFSHGLLPSATYRELRDRVMRLAKTGRLAITHRQD